MFGAARLKPGTLIDGWQVVREIQMGGFGAVHQAEQNGKVFALKVARHRDESDDTGKTHARAEREVAVLLLMEHPNIIRPRGFGYLPDGRVYCVLEYVDGWTLGDWKERTCPTFREIIRVFAKMAGALDYMDKRGVQHRDLKPSNVMIRRGTGEPVIIDLGCAAYENAEELTTTPLPPGTDRYRSPQQREFLYKHGRKQGARYPFSVKDELFSVGAMLYELLTDPLPTKNRLPPDFDEPALLPSPREVNPRVPEALSALVEELLAYEPARRPESFEVLRRKLSELAEHQGQEYGAEAHPPSLQRQPAPGGEGQAARLATPGKRGWRRTLARAGMVSAAVLAAGAAAWLAREERPAPALPPEPREATAPAVLGTGTPSPPVNSSPVQDPAPTAPQEGSTVKPQPSDALEPPRTAGAPNVAPPALAEPGTSAWCKSVALFLAMAHPGCASVQLKAQPFDCPPGAVDAMQKLGWTSYESYFPVILDERGPAFGDHQFILGAPVTGFIHDEVDVTYNLPPRSLLHGKIFVSEETEYDRPFGWLIVIYDHIEIPGKGKYPVCLVAERNPVTALKDGVATAQNYVTVTAYNKWKFKW